MIFRSLTFFNLVVKVFLALCILLIKLDLVANFAVDMSRSTYWILQGGHQASKAAIVECCVVLRLEK